MAFSQLRSYLWVDDLSKKEVLRIFSRAEQIKKQLKMKTPPLTLQGKQVSLVFSEASTRTKMSFQMAAQRLGAQCMIIDNVRLSSMSKGESFLDTFLSLHSIGPDIFVIRCKEDEPLDEIQRQSEIPVINGGYGSKAHPTQALLDLFTMKEHFGRLEGLKVLFVGDVDHSRVVASNVRLLKIFGAQSAICAPEDFRQKYQGEMKVFESLEEAIPWCDVYMGLRIQMERLAPSLEESYESMDPMQKDWFLKIKNSKDYPMRKKISDAISEFEKKQFQENYSLGARGLNRLSDQAVIMHPGPVNWEMEFDPVVAKDPRLLIWKQKENGVSIRGALMEFLLKVEQ